VKKPTKAKGPLEKVEERRVGRVGRNGNRGGDRTMREKKDLTESGRAYPSVEKK